jgi:hypothetical protein
MPLLKLIIFLFLFSLQTSSVFANEQNQLEAYLNEITASKEFSIEKDLDKIKNLARENIYAQLIMARLSLPDNEVRAFAKDLNYAPNHLDIEKSIDASNFWYDKAYNTPLSKEDLIHKETLEKLRESDSELYFTYDFLNSFLKTPALIYGTKTSPLYNEDKALKWMEKLADAGEEFFIFVLAYSYTIGKNHYSDIPIDLDLKKAEFWITKYEETDYDPRELKFIKEEFTKAQNLENINQ